MKALLPLTVLLACNFAFVVGSPALAQERATAETGETAGTAETVGTAETAATGETALAEKLEEFEECLECEDLDDGEDRVAMGQNLVIEEGETVDGDAVCIGGNLTVRGTVCGDAVCVGGLLTATPTAVICGDAVSVGGTTDLSPQADIRGERVAVEGNIPGLQGLKWLGLLGEAASDLADRITAAASEVVFFGFLIFLALLLTVFLPRQAERVEEHLAGAFPYSALIGVAALILIPLATLVLTISIVGIPIVPLLLLAMLVCMFVGYIVMGRVLGRKLVGERHAMYQIFIGLLVLQGPALFGDLLSLPGGLLEKIGGIFVGIGWVIFIGVSFIGLGAVVYSKFGKRTLADTEKARDERKAARANKAAPPASTG